MPRIETTRKLIREIEENLTNLRCQLREARDSLISLERAVQHTKAVCKEQAFTEPTQEVEWNVS